ncbi:MAG: hypothetical protein QOE45_424 [Frankiaceae bacterium]|jgi:hypothetical protein|nr:hypothetical protein [Frankiaceae bacterium]
MDPGGSPRRERRRRWPVVAGAVLAAVVVALLLRSPAGSPQRRPAAASLAAPVVAPGRVGGLLPDVTLRGRVRTANARELRPAVVMLVAPGCDCVEAVRHVVREAAAYRLVTYLVETGDSPAGTEILAARAGGDVGPYADPAGALAAAYGLRTDAALVLVRADGVVTQTVAAVGPALRLGTALAALVSA